MYQSADQLKGLAVKLQQLQLRTLMLNALSLMSLQRFLANTIRLKSVYTHLKMNLLLLGYEHFRAQVY